MAQNNVVHRSRVHPVGSNQVTSPRNKQGAVLGDFRQAPVRAADQGRVEWDYVHQIAKAQLFLRQTKTDLRERQFQRRIDEQFYGIVPGLAVNLDRTRKIRGAVVIHPVIVREPRIGIGDCDEIAGAIVLKPRNVAPATVNELLDTFMVPEKLAHLAQRIRIIYVDVGQLMIGYGKGAAGARIQKFSA